MTPTRIARRLAGKPIRTSRSLQHCVLCSNFIRPGENYRDGARYGMRAHSACFDAARREVAA